MYFTMVRNYPHLLSGAWLSLGPFESFPVRSSCLRLFFLFPTHLLFCLPSCRCIAVLVALPLPLDWVSTTRLHPRQHLLFSPFRAAPCSRFGRKESRWEEVDTWSVCPLCLLNGAFLSPALWHRVMGQLAWFRLRVLSGQKSG